MLAACHATQENNKHMPHMSARHTHIFFQLRLASRLCTPSRRRRPACMPCRSRASSPDCADRHCPGCCGQRQPGGGVVAVVVGHHREAS